MKNKILYFLCFFIITSGIIARFYNLSWGAPFFFHPDERNIASSVSQLSIPNNLNPHFFAYGSLPLYTIYGIGLLSGSTSFESSIIISRILSALFSIATLYVLFLIGKKMASFRTGLILVLLGSVMPGFIQYAHFGTFEMWITFLTTLLLYLCILLFKKPSPGLIFYSGATAAALLATKISTAVLIPMPLLALLLYFINTKRKYVFLKYVLLFFVVLCGVFTVTSPYVFLDYQAFKNSIFYESAVAFGSLPVFYTQSFNGSIPIAFQFTHIYPFIISLPLTILFAFCIPLFLFLVIQAKKIPYIFIGLFFLILFFSQAIFYAKWIRYIIPTIPFILLIIVLTIQHLLISLKRHKRIFLEKTVKVLCVFAFVSSMFYSFFYILHVHLERDTRLAALDFARGSVPINSRIASEVYDLGIVSFNPFFPNITLVNFYDWDVSFPIRDQYLLGNAQFIILPSQRILKTRLNNPTTYPEGYAFYSSLFSKDGKFTKIYETPCPVTCQILYNFGHLEETAYIFDRPGVYIFKRND